MMFGWDHGWGAGQWLAMSLMMLVFWGALISLVVWLVRSARPEPRSHTTPPSTPPSAHAEEVLSDRFARGEIDDEEFTRRRELLHSGSTRE